MYDKSYKGIDLTNEPSVINKDINDSSRKNLMANMNKVAPYSPDAATMNERDDPNNIVLEPH